MELSLKDFIYITASILAIGITWSRFTNDLKNNSKEIEKLSNFFKRVAIDDNGSIKLVNHTYCAEQKKQLSKQIEIGRKSTSQAIEKLIALDKKITLIMYHLKIPEQLGVKDEVD